jgi:hypothetical protein
MIRSAFTSKRSSTAVFSSIEEAAEAPWNDVVGAMPAAQHGSLRTFESTSTVGMPPVYFALGGTESPAAVAVGRLATDTSHYVQLTEPLLGRATMLAPALARIIGPTLVLGLRPSYGAPILADSRESRQVQESLLNELCGAIEDYADEQGLSIAVVGITSRDQAVTKLLRSRGFRETQGYPTAELDVCWSSWDGYLMHLKVKRRRVIRRETEAFNVAGCRIRVPAPTDPLPRDLYKLLQEHYQRRNRRPAPYDESLLEDMRQNLPHNSRIYMADMNDRILGFVAALWKDDAAVAAYIGISQQARAQNLFVYFNFIYQLARDAPALGLKRVLFGSTVYDAKRLRGCSITPSYLFLRPAGGVTRLASRPVLAMHRRWYQKKFKHLLSS